MKKTAREIYYNHTAKRGNKPNAVVLTTKAIGEIILCLESARRAGDMERRYLAWLISILEAHLPEPKPSTRRKKGIKK